MLPGPAPGVGANPFGRYYEIPLAIQDRSFNADGSLFFPDSREFFDGFPGPYIPGDRCVADWNPEFFGNTMVVNGRTWPLPGGRAAALPLPAAERLQLAVPDPEDRHRSAGRAAGDAGNAASGRSAAEGGFLPRPCSWASC